MNIKMAINAQLSKQVEQKQNHRYGDHLEGYQLGRGTGRIGEKVQGLRSTNRQLQNSLGDVKYGIRNGAAKELIHTHDPWT